MKVLQKIENWRENLKVKKLSEDISLDINLMIHYLQKDMEKIREHIKDFNKKFYPELIQKGDFLFPESNFNEEELKNFGFNEKEIMLAKSQHKKGLLNQFETLFSQRTSLQNFEDNLEKVENYGKKFNDYSKKDNLDFKIVQNINFSQILNLSKKDIEILQKKILSDIKLLKGIEFLKMTERIDEDD